jgi:hypothetical protein
MSERSVSTPEKIAGELHARPEAVGGSFLPFLVEHCPHSTPSADLIEKVPIS